MTVLSSICLVLTLALASTARAEQRAYELRVYTAEDGKLEALHTRFREHTLRIFAKHGMTVVGFWTPTSGEQAANTLIYLLSFPSAQARADAWKAFREDPEWQKVQAESEKGGKLVKKVESTMLAPTDYSPLR